MKKKEHNRRFWKFRYYNIFNTALIIALTVILYFYDSKLYYIFAPIGIITIGYSLYGLIKTKKDITTIIKNINTNVNDEYNNNLINHSVCVLVTNEHGEIVWYNDLFVNTVIKNKDALVGDNFENVFLMPVNQIMSNPGIRVSYDDNYYQVYSHNSDSKMNLKIFYFIDVTSFYNTAVEYELSRPAVIMMLIDNFEETTRNLNDQQRSVLLGEIYRVIDNMMGITNGFIQRLSVDKYIILLEKRDVDKLKQDRFDILDKIKEVMAPNKTAITLSLGLAVGKTLSVAESDARQALDMALGRGGDQVAIKTDHGYEFFGGVSRGVEKRTKVKTRIVANALLELIKNCDNIIIMGHRFGDLDSLGSSVGLTFACRALGKNAHILIDLRKNLAGGLIKHLEKHGKMDMFISPEQGYNIIRENTLLFIMDTHVAGLVENNNVYSKAKNVVVIDHHRKLVNYIDNAVIFYHEPYASSTCEMVTELIQYFGEKCRITNIEAEALLSGIMLDTKNFIIKAGVRTFEAAAYLRRMGADTLEVRKMFTNSMETYQRKSRVVASAEVYNKCAVSICDFFSQDMRIIAAQAADELLGINGVEASFVIFEENEIINISARSMGSINVQIIMEKLGGGGHQTMAAAQVSNTTCDRVRQTLLESVDAVVD